MADPDARIEATSLGPDGKFSAKAMRDIAMANAQMYGPEYIDAVNFRKPEFTIYVYSVVDPRPAGAQLYRSFPPLIPRLRIAELKDGERYAIVTTVPHPMNQQCMRENGERYIDSHNGYRVAMDIVDPDNLTFDQDFQVDPSRIFSQGNNYGRLGVFWSLNNPPTIEEIQRAVGRKETYYRARLQQARILEMTNPRQLAEYISINDHIAADYFHEEFTWHKYNFRPTTCPNCGEVMKPGAAFHKSDQLDGGLCVIDWKRAVEAGVKNRHQVPEEKRWWQDTKSGFKGWATPQASREEPPEVG